MNDRTLSDLVDAVTKDVLRKYNDTARKDYSKGYPKEQILYYTPTKVGNIK